VFVHPCMPNSKRAGSTPDPLPRASVQPHLPVERQAPCNSDTYQHQSTKTVIGSLSHLFLWFPVLMEIFLNGEVVMNGALITLHKKCSTYSELTNFSFTPLHAFLNYIIFFLPYLFVSVLTLSYLIIYM
jgi:hypothetical protein